MACAHFPPPAPISNQGQLSLGSWMRSPAGASPGSPSTPAGLKPKGLACQSCPVCVHVGPQDLAPAVPLVNLHDTFGFKWTIKRSLPWQEVFLL